ncbi:hypothetical protein AGMMS49992_17060 [Clostridia bacterium]|nr:hypothetical protein AGMMS49992_17060 [Clostridia bacterium]
MKRFISILATAAMLLALVVPAFASEYSDHRIINMSNAHTNTEFYTSKDAEPDPDDPAIANYDQAIARYNAYQEAAARYNAEIHFDSTNMAGATQSLSNSAMAATPDYDFYYNDMQVAIPAALSGYAVALESFIPADDDIWTDQSVLTPIKLPGQDATYLFKPSGINFGAFTLGYNKTLLDAKGLADPQELYAKGQWTWEAWRQMLLALTEDTDGDGAIDVYGYSGFWTWFLEGMLMSNAAAIAGGPTQTLDSPQTIEVLEFVNTIYNVDKTAMPWNDDWGSNNQFKNGNIGFFIACSWILNDDPNAAGYDLRVVPFPCGPSGDPATNKGVNLTGNVFLIPKNCDDPYRVYMMLKDTIDWFQGDVDLRDGDLDWLADQLEGEENMEITLDMSSRLNFDIWNSINEGGTFSIVPMTRGEQTPAQVSEAYKNFYQAQLDAYFSK